MTPGVHPDPLVNEPTGVVASAVSDTEISLAFAAINSNDVIIVFDTDRTFTAPTGDAPSVGDSFAGGTVVYVGQVSPFAHTGLTANTQYYYVQSCVHRFRRCQMPICPSPSAAVMSINVPSSSVL